MAATIPAPGPTERLWLGGGRYQIGVASLDESPNVARQHQALSNPSEPAVRRCELDPIDHPGARRQWLEHVLMPEPSERSAHLLVDATARPLLECDLARHSLP